MLARWMTDLHIFLKITQDRYIKFFNSFYCFWVALEKCSYTVSKYLCNL